MPFQSPNHTQIPNDLFDVMLPDMGLAELKVTLAILRKTLGWQKSSDKISLTQLEKLTGLSRQGVIDGCSNAEERGTVIRITDSLITEWVVNMVDQNKGKVVKPVDQTSQASRPEVVKPVDTQKKGNKDKEKELGSDKPHREPSDAQKELAHLEMLFCELTGLPAPARNTDKERRTSGEMWWQPLRRIQGQANGSSDKVIRLAVQKMRKDNLTIYSPKSIEKVAIATLAEMPRQFQSTVLADPFASLERYLNEKDK